MPKSNLKMPVDYRSSNSRTELADAIAAHQALAARLAAAQAAGSWEKRAQLKRNVELAEAAVETAKADDARHLTDQLLGKIDAAIAPTGLKVARAALQDARDQLEAWQAVEGSLASEVKKLRDEVGWAKNIVESAVIKAIESSREAQSVFERYKDLQRKRAGQRKLMELLSLYAPAGWDLLHDPDDHDDVSGLIGEWQGAIEALERDAGAPLPG